MREKATEVFLMLVPVLMTICFLIYVKPAVAGEIDYRPLELELRDYLEQQPGKYGLYLIDLESNETMGINERDEFHAASTFKVPLTIYVYRQVADGQMDPDMMLTLRSSHMEEGTGRLQFSPLGIKKSVRELVQNAIVYSDNVATNILIEEVGRNTVKDYMASLGGEVTDVERNFTSPRDMGVYMREAVSFADENRWGAKLMEHLRNTMFNDRIPNPLPDVPVASKIGNWPPTGTYNDVAYVEHLRRPYILAVFSRQTPGYSEAVRVIQEVSRTVYEYQDHPPRTVELTMDEQQLLLAETPFVNQGATMVPLRALADAVPEITLGWDQSNGVVNISSHWPGAETEVALERADKIIIIDGRSYMPIRDLCSALDLGLEWNGEKKRANIVTP